MKSVKIHVVEGGDYSPQSGPLEIALQEVRKTVAKSGLHLNYEIKRRRDIRGDPDMSPFTLALWLSDADAHIIATHPSQANTHFWNVTDVIDALDTLKVHPGFPRNDKIECITVKLWKWLSVR